METLNPADLARIASEMNLPIEQIEVAVSLLNADNTIPFITRYRRDETGGLEEPQLRKIQSRLSQLSSLRERKASIIKSIEAQTEIDESLRSKIENCYSAKHLEDLYLPFKQKKTSWARQARDLGLQPLAEAVLLEGLSQEDFQHEVEMATDAAGNPIDRETVLRGVRSLVGETFTENIDLRNRLRRLCWKSGELKSSKTLPVTLPKSSEPSDEPKLVDIDPAVSSVIENVVGLDSESNAAIESTESVPESLSTESLQVRTESAVPDVAEKTDVSTESTSTVVELPNVGEEAKPVTKTKRKRKKKRREEERFKDYFDYSESIRTIPPHRVLAVNRGEKEKKLKVKIQLPEDRLWEIVQECLVPATHPQHDLLVEAAKDVLSRSLIPALEREIRRELTERAEDHAIEVFTTNLRSLLLQPPIQGYRVLALDPGFKSGCKAAALDDLGNFVESTIVSIVGNKQKRDASLLKLSELVRQHNLNLIAIGNGTGCRETELLVSKLLTGALADLDLRYVIVNEAGASIYSTSEIGREEFPDVDPTIRSAISIGRRVLDPLSELVKINPAHIGVGLYQHDVKSKHLEESLDAIVESCVNYVGVDANTASPALLSYVAGLSQSTAKKICEHRKQHGPFPNREALREVAGIGNATFVQCAGFLRIFNGDQPLDATAIHPESYEVAQAVLDRIECSVADLKSLGKEDNSALKLEQNLTERLKQVNVDHLAEQLSIGRLRMQDIFDVLCRPSRDPRDSVPAPVFRSGVLDIEDLSLGMHLRGQVLNVVDFGIFVDIGLGESGLVHISNLSTGYIRDPHQFFSVGDVLDVWVKSIDKKLKRVSLTAIDPAKNPEVDPSKTGERNRSARANTDQRPDARRNHKRNHASKSPTSGNGAQGNQRRQKRNANRTQSGSSGNRQPQRHSQKRNAPVVPITNEMASGKAPLRSFSDLVQFVSQQDAVSTKKDDSKD